MTGLKRKNVVYLLATVGLCVVCSMLDTTPVEAVLATAFLGYWLYNDPEQKKVEDSSKGES
ncbi:MAG: hypothetical protein J6B01_04880 [Ruminococcus sp.]|nr:hypothetical protein [Ruminococcus sp.]MBO5319127.1 hypothetical protein [Ruminococcus sp.]